MSEQDSMILAIVLVAYFIPWFIAAIRQHRNTVPIFLVNLIFGWAFIGWVVALIWAFTSNTHKSLNNSR